MKVMQNVLELPCAVEMEFAEKVSVLAIQLGPVPSAVPMVIINNLTIYLFMFLTSIMTGTIPVSVGNTDPSVIVINLPVGNGVTFEIAVKRVEEIESNGNIQI